MSTELSNGVIIPEEYSDDWYDEMSINLRKLNDVITAASDNATDIQRLDTDKANQSDLTALSGRVSQNETDIIALQTAVSGALKREIVQTLPTEDISTTTIYMIRNSQSSGTNIYDEYMYINSQWELIGTSATDFINYYTKNETDNLLSGKVDNSTLGSYYTKTESDNLLSAKANQTDLTSLSGRVTQNETDITALQTAVSGALKREIVQSLPTQDISTTTIYMIRNTTTSGDNIYDEYMYINNLWELIGTSATDFSNYYTKTEIDTLLSYKANDSDVVHKSGNETISGDKVFNNRLIKNIDVVLGTAPSTGKFSNIDIADNNKSSLLQILGGVYDTGQSYARFFVQNKTADDGTGLSPTGTLRTCGFNINLPATSTSEGQGSITPRANKATDFGLSSYQWRNVWCEKLFLNGTQLDPSAFALDNAVVHLSGNETVGGQKTFANNLIIVGRNTDSSSAIQLINSDVVGDSANGSSGFEVYGSSISDDNKIGGLTVGEYSNNGGSYATIECNRTVSDVKTSNALRNLIRNDGSKEFSAGTDNDCKLGHPYFRWSEVYATNYYYGSNNVEFSTKFVTIDTAQTITESKTFTNTIKSQKEIEFTGNRLAYILPEFSASYSGLSLCTYGSNGAVKLGTWKVDDNDNKKHVLDTSLGYLNVTIGSVNSVNCVYLTPRNSTDSKLGDSTNKWKGINGITPSSLSMPGDRSARVDISGYFTNTSSGDTNTYTAPANGWIYLSLDDVTEVNLESQTSGGLTNYGDYRSRSSNGALLCLFPIRSGDVFVSQWYTTTTATVTNAYFIPCLGNI